jgi:DnaK suppressor protein
MLRHTHGSEQRPRYRRATAISGKSKPSGINGPAAKQNRVPRRRQSRRPQNAVASRREELLAIRARLRGDMNQIADVSITGQSAERSGMPLDTADQAVGNHEQAVVVDLLTGAESILNQTESALKRIEEGRYGQCERCGKQLPAARLDVLPYAALCVQCASREEQSQFGPRGFAARR